VTCDGRRWGWSYPGPVNPPPHWRTSLQWHPFKFPVAPGGSCQVVIPRRRPMSWDAVILKIRGDARPIEDVGNDDYLPLGSLQSVAAKVRAGCHWWLAHQCEW